MFKDDYKACFDDIKGDKALLEKILEKSKETTRKAKVIKLYKNAIPAVAAVFVVALAGFMYNAGMFDGFLPSDNNEIIISEKTDNSENIKTEEKTLKDSVKEEKSEKKAETDETQIPVFTTEKMMANETEKNQGENQAEDIAENQADNMNAGISVASLESDDASFGASPKMRALDKAEYRGLSVFKEGIDEATEIYDAEEQKFTYTDFEDTKKVEITYYNELPVFDDENTGGDVLEYIGEVESGFVKITAVGISEEYLSEIIESL